VDRSADLGVQAPTAQSKAATTAAAAADRTAHAEADHSHNASALGGSTDPRPASDTRQQQPVSNATTRSAATENMIGFDQPDPFAESAAAAKNGNDSGNGDMDNNIFHDDTFDELTSMDDAGDVDFGGDDGGMDMPSAFDEAMPDMDTPAGEESGQ